MKRLFGPLLALGIVVVGTLAAARAGPGAERADALRSLGTLLTVVTGLFSAVWWHKAAAYADPPPGGADTAAQRQMDSNLLNAAAATTTGLALIGGVFSNLAWNTPEGMLAGSAFVLLLAMSGSEIHNAAVLSIHRGLRPRTVLSAVVLMLATADYAWHWLLR
jgi:hypothetical protein